MKSNTQTQNAPSYHHLVFSRKIHPELESVRVGRRWHLRVDNTASGRHPLDVSWSNLTAVPGEVVVPKRPMKHVRYSFKATVRVIGKASRWPNAEFCG